MLGYRGTLSVKWVWHSRKNSTCDRQQATKLMFSFPGGCLAFKPFISRVRCRAVACSKPNYPWWMFDKCLTRTNKCPNRSLRVLPLPFSPTFKPCPPSCLRMLWQNKSTTCWWIIEILLNDVWKQSFKSGGYWNPAPHWLNFQLNHFQCVSPHVSSFLSEEELEVTAHVILKVLQVKMKQVVEILHSQQSKKMTSS